ncbi:MAG TPA: type I methionyl aminopeptidase [Nitrospiria bacterium]|nr:type I methionyl aminopeptidase [Nitrospiria bacterium]
MIILKSPQEIEKISHACRVVAMTLIYLKDKVDPGVTTQELDRLAEEFMVKQGARPAFKGYRDFPCTICTSINEEVVHGIPSKKHLEEGDIIGIDVGAVVEGYFGDAAITFPVGKIAPNVQRLLEVTEQALYEGISQAYPGNRLSDISHAIQERAEAAGFGVVRDFVGHGIGKNLHEDPQVPNFGLPGQGPRLKEGMVLAIEPMINMGGAPVKVLEDNWTVVTQDGSFSAHFEHTISVTPQGPMILTKL